MKSIGTKLFHLNCDWIFGNFESPFLNEIRLAKKKTEEHVSPYLSDTLWVNEENYYTTTPSMHNLWQMVRRGVQNFKGEKNTALIMNISKK